MTTLSQTTDRILAENYNDTVARVVSRRVRGDRHGVKPLLDVAKASANAYDQLRDIGEMLVRAGVVSQRDIIFHGVRDAVRLGLERQGLEPKAKRPDARR